MADETATPQDMPAAHEPGPTDLKREAEELEVLEAELRKDLEPKPEDPPDWPTSG